MALLLVLLGMSYRNWNARNRPPLITGNWYLDRLDTDEIENNFVTFSTTGEFIADENYGMRWQYRDGSLYFRSWRLNDESWLTQQLTNTAIYAYFIKADWHPLQAEFSEDDTVMTLIADDTDPRNRLRLRRSSPWTKNSKN